MYKALSLIVWVKNIEEKLNEREKDSWYKTKNMIKRIEENTMKFPIEFMHHCWHRHLPVAQDFIDSKKTPNKVKRLCMQTLLERAYHLMQMKPNDHKNIGL